jgi:purine-binding chemotaxis protein CheW
MTIRAQALHSEDLHARGLEGKYLTFALAGEEYGISISRIKEIIGMMPVTPIPQTASFVKGVINLRGKVIPVMDLRLRFQMQAQNYTERTCIIVVEAVKQRGNQSTGLVVDSVSEVMNLRTEDIAETPYLGTLAQENYILGMARMEGGVKTLLDIDVVLACEEFSTLHGDQVVSDQGE